MSYISTTWKHYLFYLCSLFLLTPGFFESTSFSMVFSPTNYSNSFWEDQQHSQCYQTQWKIPSLGSSGPLGNRQHVPSFPFDIFSSWLTGCSSFIQLCNVADPQAQSWDSLSTLNTHFQSKHTGFHGLITTSKMMVCKYSYPSQILPNQLSLIHLTPYLIPLLGYLT